MTTTEIIQQLQLGIANGARFISFLYSAKGTGEVAVHNVLFGVSIANAYKRDLAILENKVNTLEGVYHLACSELVESFRESLVKGIGNNSAYTCKGVYAPVSKGIKVHNETGDIYISGFIMSKQVIEPGVYKTVKSSEKTIAKNQLRKALKSSRFRQYVLAASNIAGIKANGKVLEIQTN